MATILNDGLQFSDLSPDDRHAFLRTPERKLFDARTKFYKFTDNPLVGNEGISPWWSFFDSSRLSDGTVVDGFEAAEEYASRLGKSHREYQQVRSAISERFNNRMRDLLMIQLNTKAWGFAGVASGQKEFKDPALANVYFIGGRV